MQKYVHGYSDKESCRLTDQANTLADLLQYLRRQGDAGLGEHLAAVQAYRDRYGVGM